MRDAAFQSVAVGFFDGVHLGHQAILDKAESALTFAAHPLEVLRPEKAPQLIMSLEERLGAISRPTTVLEFTPELAAMTAEEFAAKYFRGKKVYSGANWTFGKGGVGNVGWLNAHGYAAEVVPYATYEGAPISSTRVRAALLNGEIEDANAMMGRPFVVNGSSFKGKGKGKELGFPTINIKPNKPMALKKGVYKVELDGELGIANFGYAPTFGENAWSSPTLEVHLLNGDHLHSSLNTHISTLFVVSFLSFLREERRFDSIEALKAQIKDDISRVHS